MTAHILQILLEGGTTNVIDFWSLKYFVQGSPSKVLNNFYWTASQPIQLMDDSVRKWINRGRCQATFCANGIRNLEDLVDFVIDKSVVLIT